jgi:hypothetical protein
LIDAHDLSRSFPIRADGARYSLGGMISPADTERLLTYRYISQADDRAANHAGSPRLGVPEGRRRGQ